MNAREAADLSPVEQDERMRRDAKPMVGRATVYKYEIPLGDAFVLNLPRHPQMLGVQVQQGKPCLWALVDTDWPHRPYSFRVVVTGHPIQDVHEWQYIGTFQMFDGVFVGHLFWRPQ